MAWVHSTNALAIIPPIGACSGKGSVEIFSFNDWWAEQIEAYVLITKIIAQSHFVDIGEGNDQAV